jgi:hypothetical protein
MLPSSPSLFMYPGKSIFVYPILININTIMEFPGHKDVDEALPDDEIPV